MDNRHRRDAPALVRSLERTPRTTRRVLPAGALAACCWLVSVAAVGAGDAMATAAAPILPNAGAPLELSLRDALLSALQNNRSLAVERLAPEIVRTQEDIERAVFDPVVGAEASGRREQSETPANGRFRDVHQRHLGASASLRRALETGTTVAAAAEISDLSASYSDRVVSAGVEVSVTQALLRGRSIEANTARIRQARISTAMSEHEVRGVIEALAANVEDTYWELTLAERRIEIFNESLKVAEQYLRDTRERIAAGAVAEIELAAAEAEIPLRRQGLINARGALDISRLRLLSLINLPGEPFWERPVVPRDQPVAPELRLDPVEDHVAVALRLRPDLCQARLQMDLQDLQVVQTRNGLLPRLDAFVNLGKTGYAGSFLRAVDNVDAHNYTAAVGLTYEYAVGNREAQARYRQARLSREQAETALANLSQLVELDVRTAYVDVKRSAEQVSASAATCRLREETLRAETEKAKVGRSTSFLVAQAQRDLLASQIVEVEAVVGQLNTLTTLHRLESSLLERRGIQLEATGAP
jgi:outer membrane protein TolC